MGEERSDKLYSGGCSKTGTNETDSIDLRLGRYGNAERREVISLQETFDRSWSSEMLRIFLQQLFSNLYQLFSHLQQGVSFVSGNKPLISCLLFCKCTSAFALKLKQIISTKIAVRPFIYNFSNSYC